jgi:hypothetical protein
MNQYTTISDVVEFLFSRPPMEPCTFQVFSNGSKGNMFPVLMDVLINGAKKLYGPDITPPQITDAQFEVLKKYMLSLGYQVKHNYTYNEDNSKALLINIWFEPYKYHTNCKGRLIFT